jgi:hypothetical protein
MKNPESTADRHRAKRIATPSPPASMIETAAPVHMVEDARKE